MVLTQYKGYKSGTPDHGCEIVQLCGDKEDGERLAPGQELMPEVLCSGLGICIGDLHMQACLLVKMCVCVEQIMWLHGCSSGSI